MANCPKCSRYDNSGTVGGRLNHHIVEMEEQKLESIKYFTTYICPECGYTEFYYALHLSPLKEKLQNE